MDKRTANTSKGTNDKLIDDRSMTYNGAERISRIRLEQHTKIFASMCPDEILDHYDDYKTREYYTTLMLGDVSGFTDLTEKYTKTGRGGPSKLSETLNSYIGAMVREILSHNGDVLKFSGDAFIVMWKLREGMIMRDIVTEAIQTACVIQKHFGTYDTDVGVTLRVKLAIASGRTYFTSIGDPETTSYYVITGRPVWDVKLAERLCRGGDILVTSSTWQWANPNEYVHDRLPDGIHTQIIACLAIGHQYRNQDIGDEDEKDHGQLDDKGISNSISDDDDDVPHTEDEAVLMNLTGDTLRTWKNVDYSLRPKILKVAKAQLKNMLKSYIVRPVVRSVEMDESLEHLTEMRQVVILFINVITTEIEKKELIALVDTAYKSICETVGDMQGCVNKMSLFDKDLIFLCIFGLRGDKHELESQIGLRCASKARRDLQAMKNIKSVTIAVTTGMTYCGVIGHILRREYTVIGTSVNKAARLMVAYNNKVICDRESFLRSHLEARHFVLQEPKHLKGITNVGPVYEFREQAKYDIPELAWRKYPILGRETEIEIFRRILTDLIGQNEAAQRLKPEYNALVIKGEPRIGKTRLLDEIALNIPEGVLHNYISLVMDDFKTSYGLIHLIFSAPLGFNLATTSKEREDKLIARLGRIREPEFLCAFNQPFNVRFAMSARYKALSEMRKRKLLRKFLLKLMRGCFREQWVVIIDDAEYSDDDSMPLFRAMAKQNTVFFVLSVGYKLGAAYELHPAITEKALIIELDHIGKWYHAALACQILDLRGIPAELEKLIQERSLGNPGWIESYLLSLVQSGSLVIMNVGRREAEETGYVLPPIAMLERFMAERAFTDTENSEKERSDSWKMYRTSFRDNAVSLLIPPGVVHEMEINGEATITVCKFAEDFALEESAGAEVTMEIMILKLFDSLTPLEQLLLKCASVLGEVINRKMLQSLMVETSTREIGLAIQKLFDLRIFGCAVGDFTAGPRPLIFYRNTRNINAETEVTCECAGLVISEELSDLPRYASCGLMRFKMSMFRELTYESLTEKQKMELHSEALKYLRRRTRRCVTCGELQFVRLLGKRTVSEINKRKPTIERLLDMHGEMTSPREEEAQNRQRIIKERIRTCLNIFRKVERRPTRTFSGVDLANCQCHLILTTVYTQMLEHCRGIGRNDLTLTAILEFVEVCLSGYNIPQARRLLSEAQDLLREMFKSNEERSLLLPYFTGKVQSFEGQCYLESGFLSEARTKLDLALNTLGYEFPRQEIAIDLMSVFQLELLQWKLFCRKHADTVDEYTANYIEQLANCLAQLFNVFRAKGMKKHARLAAIWGLNAALNSSRDFVTLCTSFTNMIITAHVYQSKWSIVPYLEDAALSFCAERSSSLEPQEFKVIAEVYAGVFFSRWSRGEIPKAIGIGFIATRMAQTVDSAFLKLLVLPRLAHLLMLSCRHSEVVTLLRELEFVSQSDLDKSGRTWYYAMCADVRLDTGLTVLSFRSCERYYLREGETMISLRDPEAERRYFTSMWLWCVRTQQWEASKIWSGRNVTAESVVDEHTVAATITALKKLEGLLILYVREITGKNIDALATMAEIKEEFKRIEKMIKIAKIAIPRYMLLKAYYHMVQSRKRTAMRLLRRTKKLSMKVDNRMIYAWANHCQLTWLDAVSSVHADLWKEKTKIRADNGWDEVNVNDSTIAPFTFPLPRIL